MSWKTFLCVSATVFLAGAASAQELPGVFFLDPSTEDGPHRFVIGGSAQEPPAAEDVCLAWTFEAPAGKGELYPEAEAGSFVELFRAWSPGQDETAACRPAAMPELALGPADELWLLTSEPRLTLSRSMPAQWDRLLNGLEAAYRHASPTGAEPLAEMEIGKLGSCVIRSRPAPLFGDGETGTWQAVELGSARVRRFLWWAEGTEEAGCADTGTAELRLFPVPSTAGEDEETAASSYLFAASVPLRAVGFFDLDPQVQGPRLRRGAVAPPVNVPSFELSAEERVRFAAGELDLCTVAELGELCRRQAQVRRQLTTVFDAAEPVWPEARIERARAACAAALADRAATAAAACADPHLWAAPHATGLVHGFRGDLVVSRQPRIVESWNEDSVRWHLIPDEAGSSWSADELIRFDLLDGEAALPAAALWVRVPWTTTVAHRARTWWPAMAGGIVLMLVFLVPFLVQRRAVNHRRELERLIDQTVERKVKAALARGAGAPSRGAEAALGRARAQLEGRADELASDLKELARGLAEELGERAHAEITVHEAERRNGKMLSSPRGTLPPEVTEDALETWRPDQESGHWTVGPFEIGPVEDEDETAEDETENETADDVAVDLLSIDPLALVDDGIWVEGEGLETVYREIEDLEGSDRQHLVKALEAVGQLGCWIELLWPVLQEASGFRLENVADHLPEPAGEEWRRARRILEDFVADDVPTVRQLLRMLSASDGDTTATASCGDSTFLAGTGLLDRERELPERFKRYLEPFDHPGRLAEVTLALQYLVEAYPIEQLSSEQRTKLRKDLRDAIRSVHLEEDFHHLVAAVATGIGLVYRPVAYYRSRVDKSDYAFVRQQVSPISLTDRVGFAATTDPAVIVRLKRPFFYQSNNDVYYAGHAHVARG